MKEINKFAEWEKLSIKEKNAYINKFWFRKNEKNDLKNEILESFKKSIGDRKKEIKQISFINEGFYSPAIAVELKKGRNIRLPRIFDIFAIRKI
ncbi:MAG: hypothetical protein A2252_05260 [Elusimicrobia bacterium RIFOXYA2_FULL_39_19]|nr:MAG: hypothetical protein A2252_05260 [Elusimicrobia bacterium RIFOXYA2_FULL_39_19]